MDEGDRFAVREKAFGTLRGLGAHAEPALRRALAGKPTLEARRRVEELLGRLRQDASPQPRGDTLRAWRSVWVVERTGTTTAKTLLKEWAKGPPSSRLTAEAREALRRLER